MVSYGPWWFPSLDFNIRSSWDETVGCRFLYQTVITLKAVKSESLTDLFSNSFRQELDSTFALDDLIEAIKLQFIGQFPGIDGLPVEFSFYQHFWAFMTLSRANCCPSAALFFTCPILYSKDGWPGTAKELEISMHFSAFWFKRRKPQIN